MFSQVLKIKIGREPFPYLLGSLLFLAYGLPHSQAIWAAWFPELARVVYVQESLAALLWQHLALVIASSSVAVGLGMAAAWLVSLPQGHAYRPLLETLASAGQTFPPVAVLALAVPVMGFGEEPALLALTLYALLPVVHATLAGLASVPSEVLHSSEAMGMTRWQQLWQVQAPLAWPVWLGGIRTAVVINIGTAAIASTVGAKTLGSPIIVGLSGFNTAYVLQGALLVGLLALAVDALFVLLARFGPAPGGFNGRCD